MDLLGNERHFLGAIPGAILSVRGRGRLRELHFSSLVVFLVKEAGEAQHPGRLRDRQIASELAGHGPLQRFRLLRANTLDSPNDLNLSADVLSV